jgi:hypothetical protein
MVKCICINDKNKPAEIPSSKWVKAEEDYHITHVYYHPNQGIQGCSLYEKPLGEDCAPYETFRLSRFAISVDDLEKLIELIKNCTELNYLDIQALIKESQLEIIEE